jgi:hypothetical protein
MSNAGYATAKSVNRLQRSITRVRPVQYVEERPMKLTFKQRIRNWLMNDDAETDYSGNLISVDSEGPNIQSQGFRLNVYSAGGGTIIETTKYDRQKDDHRHSLYVVTDDKDLGEELSKIITMESLR